MEHRQAKPRKKALRQRNRLGGPEMDTTGALEYMSKLHKYKNKLNNVDNHQAAKVERITHFIYSSGSAYALFSTRQQSSAITCSKHETRGPVPSNATTTATV
jgi:hypothetical protein